MIYSSFVPNMNWFDVCEKNEISNLTVSQEKKSPDLIELKSKCVREREHNLNHPEHRLMYSA
jgi:hypothetical protein